MDGGDSRSFSHPLKEPILEHTYNLQVLFFQELPSHFTSLFSLRFPPVGQFGPVKLAGRDTNGLFVKAAMGTMDGIIDTVSAIHPVMPLIGLLKTQGKLVVVGAPDKPLELPVFPLLTGPRKCHQYISSLT
ncbi:hypothetical protein CsSME_00002478 [Camellia sinensis var. sinensis]